MTFPDPVSTLFRHKSNRVFSLPSDASVYSALEVMAEKKTGCLLVIDDNRLVGIVSERDYIRKVDLRGRYSKTAFIREIMTPSPITIGEDASVDEAMCIMRDNNIRHLPVLDSEQNVAGVLSMRDLLSSIVSLQSRAIAQFVELLSNTG
jgi:CBS domain-containing protein